MKKHYLLALAWVLLVLPSLAQNVGINADGSQPNKNAMLDIKSGNKGLLIPRMDSLSRLAIPNTKGLLVYDTTTSSFWYNTGSGWLDLINPGRVAWLLKGNSGTRDSVNFLGTTDSVPLNFRVNNQLAGRLDGGRANAFFGHLAGSASKGRFNTALGEQALLGSAANSGEGNYQTAVGAQALYSNQWGEYNTAVGVQSLYSNQVGLYNTAVGYQALYSGNSSSFNTATGYQSLYRNVGSNNTATGWQALWSNIGGVNNTATGYYALQGNISGNDNTAIGQFAMSTTTGSFNTAVGSNAMGGIGSLDGKTITALGAYTGIDGFGIENATVIGYQAVVDASNKVRIGNSAVTVIEGQVPFTTPSDGRYKFNIQDDVRGLDFILRLRPVTYQFDVKRFDSRNGLVSNVSYDEATRIRRSGFIAQEVEKAAQESGYNFSGIIVPKKDSDHYSLSYEAFVVPLVKALQEQEKKITDLQQQIDELKKLLTTK